jgi:DNA-binding MarR family transcriptional regulator
MLELGTATTKMLAQRLDLDQSTMSRTVDGLVRRGLVERRVSERDRRVVPLRLTAAGEALGRSIDRRSDEHYRRRLEKIPDAELVFVLQAFERLVDALCDPADRDRGGGGK